MASQLPPEPPKPEKPVEQPKASADSAAQKPENKPIITDYASL